METSTDYPGVTTGEGYAVAHLQDLGDGRVPEGEEQRARVIHDLSSGQRSG